MLSPVSFGVAAHPHSSVRTPQTSSPRFGMTPEQQKEVRETMFDMLYPHYKDATSKVVDRYSNNTMGEPKISTLAYNTIVNAMAQLATFQEAPQPQNPFGNM